MKEVYLFSQGYEHEKPRELIEKGGIALGIAMGIAMVLLWVLLWELGIAMGIAVNWASEGLVGAPHPIISTVIQRSRRMLPAINSTFGGQPAKPQQLPSI